MLTTLVFRLLTLCCINIEDYANFKLQKGNNLLREAPFYPANPLLKFAGLIQTFFPPHAITGTFANFKLVTFHSLLFKCNILSSLYLFSKHGVYSRNSETQINSYCFGFHSIIFLILTKIYIKPKNNTRITYYFGTICSTLFVYL